MPLFLFFSSIYRPPLGFLGSSEQIPHQTWTVGSLIDLQFLATCFGARIIFCNWTLITWGVGCIYCGGDGRWRWVGRWRNDRQVERGGWIPLVVFVSGIGWEGRERGGLFDHLTLVWYQRGAWAGVGVGMGHIREWAWIGVGLGLGGIKGVGWIRLCLLFGFKGNNNMVRLVCMVLSPRTKIANCWNFEDQNCQYYKVATRTIFDTCE